MELIPRWDQYPTLTFRERVAFLTTEFLKLPQIDCPVMHIFEDGFYIREMNIPAGTLFLGRAHVRGHRCELVSGSVIQMLPDGTKREVHAPFAVHTTPGFHMVIYALTDVIGRTIHSNHGEERDTDLLEAGIFEPLSSLLALGDEIAQRLLPSDVAA
jgi:hypothetical protein